MMNSRNLRVLHIDDQASTGYPSDIDVVPIGIIGDVSMLGIREWEQHCRNIATEKELSFDLLTVDINFERDKTDPQNVFYERGNNVGGLHHGMVALARRSGFDAHGNVLPLAWEIRSVSPHIFTGEKTRVEAVRAYGLLRALLAEPNPNEELIACIIRENMERATPPSLSVGELHVDEMKLKNMAEVMEWELANQNPQTGSGVGAANRLLRLWRSKFLRAVQTHAVRIDRNKLSNLIDNLMQATSSYKIISRSPRSDYALPIMDWKGDECGGIRLWSIMADRVDYNHGATLDFKSEFIAVNDGEKRLVSIIGWLQEMLRICMSEGQNEITRWVKLGRQIIDWIKIERDICPPFWGTPYEKKCMIYCFLLVRSLVLPDKHPDCDDEDLANELGLIYNEQTFLRPFRETNFGLCNTAGQFRRTLRDALVQKDHNIFIDIPWLRTVLLQFCTEVLNVNQGVLEKNAPGLIA